MTHLNYSDFENMFKGADKYLIGYDKVFDRLAEFHDQLSRNIPNYPPYNIRKTDENTYVIEMAVAGFSESDIKIEIYDDKLHIQGAVSKESDYAESQIPDLLYGGLALRPFSRTFTINDQIEVESAEMINGLLKIWLERIIPESKKPEQIEINSKGSSHESELLTEHTRKNDDTSYSEVSK